MSIVVVGGGAIGLLVASRLAQSQQQSALLARPSTLLALSERPLTLATPEQTQSVPELVVAARPADLPASCQQPDLAVLCVKGYDTPSSVESLRELNPRYILTLQNGIGNEEVLVEAFGQERVISGAITTSVDLASPSEIILTKVGGIGLAPISPKTDLAPWANAFSKAGFTIKTYPDYRAMKWSKALLNMLGNATAAILDLSVSQIYADPRLVALERRAFREALAVMRQMRAKPVNLPSYPAAVLATAMALPAPILYPILRKVVGGGRGGKDPSLLRDLRAGRGRSEGAFLYGKIAEAAKQYGLPAPVNAGLWRILGSIAAGTTSWEIYRKHPERLLAEIGQA